MPDADAIETDVRYAVDIEAAPTVVWNALTDPHALDRWMLDSGLEVVSDWTVGSTIIFRGELNGHRFENHGTIRALEPWSVLEYDYWSSLSRAKVPDTPDNTTKVRFVLEAIDSGTRLTLLLHGFADWSIYRHVKFYWNGTLPILKHFCEAHRM